MYTFVIGSFKGLHTGHVEMIKHYAEISSKVVVYVTDPKSAARKTEIGSYISAKVAKEVLELVCMREGIYNVSVEISPAAFQQVVEDIKELNEEAKRLKTVYYFTFGCSNKGDDLEKRNQFDINKYTKDCKNAVLCDPSKFVYETVGDNNASDIRANITNKKFIKDHMPKSLTNYDIDYIYNLYNNEFKTSTTKHLAHLEDILLLEDKPNEILPELLDKMMNYLVSENSSLNVSRKYDGTSIIVGKNFDNHKLVSNKALFNKTPKAARTTDECFKYFKPDLAKKLNLVLQNIDKMNIEKDTLVRGDLLFTKDQLKDEIIEGKKYVTFQPNVIKYCIPKNIDNKANYDYFKIKTSSFGVAWHTIYYGRYGLKNLFETPLKDKHIFKSNPESYDVFANQYFLNRQQLKTYNDDIEFLKSVKEHLCKAISEFDFNSGMFQVLLRDKMKIQKFINNEVLSGVETFNIVKFIFDSGLEYSKEQYKYLYDLCVIRNVLVQFKNFYIMLLNDNSLDGMKMFYELKDRSKVTSSGEGYVINYNNRSYKLVERLEFSAFNMRKDIKRGWEK